MFGRLAAPKNCWTMTGRSISCFWISRDDFTENNLVFANDAPSISLLHKQAVFAGIAYRSVKALHLLLTASGIFPCRADFPSSFLYAALTTEIMRLCYGIVKYVSHTLYLRDKNQKHLLQVRGGITGKIPAYKNITTPGQGQRYNLAGEHKYHTKFRSRIKSVRIRSVRIKVEYLAGHWQLFAVHLLGLASLFCILSAYKKLLQNFRLRTELEQLTRTPIFFAIPNLFPTRISAAGLFVLHGKDMVSARSSKSSI